jgi:hypothetical protein
MVLNLDGLFRTKSGPDRTETASSLPSMHVVPRVEEGVKYEHYHIVIVRVGPRCVKVQLK